KLGEIEAHISQQLVQNNFTSKKSGTTKFWAEHCFAVPFITTETAKENHKLKYCSDGFRVRLDSAESPALWPLPSGIFTEGIEFHALVFLAQIREFYDTVIIDKIKPENYTMEQYAFSQLLAKRIRVDPDTGAVMFRLFKEFAIPVSDGVPDELFVDYDGASHLFINSLRDTSLLLV
ncbi:hypothetical protein B0H14DRAFT_2416463, partial [Mycena olivaceomarginata]